MDLTTARVGGPPPGNHQPMRIDGRTIGYVAVVGVILLAVALLMTKIARTELADRRLLTIAVVVVGAILLGGLASIRVRGRSRRS